MARLGSDAIYLSAITIGELVKGIRQREDVRRKRELDRWLLGLGLQFDGRILPVDHEVARIWGELAARAQSDGVQVPASDDLIAGTVIRNGVHVMTRTTRDVAATGAFIIDPWHE